VNSDLANITLLGNGPSRDLIGAMHKPAGATVDPARSAIDDGQNGKGRFTSSTAAVEFNQQASYGGQTTNCPPRFESYSIPFDVEQVRGN
jgi:hypothetical protein